MLKNFAYLNLHYIISLANKNCGNQCKTVYTANSKTCFCWMLVCFQTFLTFCMPGNFSCFCCQLLTSFFFQNQFQSVKLCPSWSGFKQFAMTKVRASRPRAQNVWKWYIDNGSTEMIKPSFHVAYTFLAFTLCMPGNSSCMCCRLLTFSHFFFQKKKHYQSVKRFRSY